MKRSAFALAALLAAALLAGPAHAARKPAEDKIPGFDGMYSTVQITSIYWKDKHWEPRQTVTVGALKDFRPAPDAPRCEYGGQATAGVDKATGFFHAAKFGERWTLIDPDGHPFITLGMDSVSMNRTPRGAAALKAKYGDAAGWAKATQADLKAMGCNTLGCWSDNETMLGAGKMPYTVQLNWMSGYGHQRGGTYVQPGHTGYPNDCIFVFDPGFAAYCNKQAAALAKYKNDPWLFGYFSDNEMPLKVAALDGYLKFPAGDPGRKAAEEFLAKRYGAVDTKKITEKDREDFLTIVVDRYFGTVAAAIKKVDPNHLYLGSRLHGSDLDRPYIFAAAGPYVDVCAVNYYNDWSPNYARTTAWVKAMNKPYIVTEFYAKGMDSGMANTGGAGWTVATQKDRGLFYQNFCLGLLNDPGCVGWHYFKYMDNDPTDKKTDPSNRDSNKGYVTSLYEPWPPVIELMGELNKNAYALRDYLMKRQGK